MTLDSRRSCEIEHKLRLVSGVPTRLHQVGCLASALGKSVDTIRRWERSGVLPPTPYLRVVAGTGSGRRLYSDEQLDWICWAAKRTRVARRKPFALDAFAALLLLIWADLFPGLAA